MKHVVTYSHKQKYVWYCVPKTGFRSIYEILKNKTKIDFHQSFAYKPLPSNHPLYDDSVWKDYFKFTFVRNPWDRLLSCYVQKFANPKSFYSKKVKVNSFREFIISFIQHEDLTTCNIHHRLQTELMNPKKMNFIGRFETLQKDFNKVSSKIGIGKPQLPKLNPSKHKHYTTYYDDEMNQIVQKKYKQDIELLGYDFRK